MGDFEDGLVSDQLPDGVVLVDGHGVVQLVNRAAERVLARSRDAMVGHDVRDVLPLQDTEGQDWWRCTDPWAGLPSRTGHRERLLLLPSADGPVQLLVTATYVRPRSGAPVSSVVVGLRDAIARQRAQEDHGALISTVAHELRSPLTSVKGFTATLLRRWERFTDDQKRFMLETIEHDADRVTRLIGELLDISRIDAGRLEVRCQLVDVEATARRHVERMRASGHDDRTFEVISRARLPKIWADPDRLDQIFANLLENAVRHGDGLVTMDLVTTAEQVTPSGEPEPMLNVTISDEGEGIAAEDLQRVFTRFWHSNRRGGTGLGLYLVRGLVEAHGGRITVGRAASGGAEFRFSLPASMPEHLG